MSRASRSLPHRSERRQAISSTGQLAADTERAAAEAKASAKNASGKEAEAKDRIERLKRGEAVAGLGKTVNFERVWREAGVTAADIKRMRMTDAIVQLGEVGFETLLDEIDKRHRTAEATARRKVLRQLLADPRRHQ
jgi:hypothetical protein